MKDIQSDKKGNFKFKTIIVNYFSPTLDAFDDNFEQRLSLYLVYGLLIGVITFLSLNILGTIRGYPVIQAFQGMYSWHTTLNFTLCFVLVTKISRFLRSRSEDPEAWKVFNLWLIGITSFTIAFILQRTVVYAGVEQYNPSLIEYYQRNPQARPTIFIMLTWSFLFWLPTFIGLVQIALWKQKRYTRYCEGARVPETRRWSLDGGKTLVNIDDIIHISMEDHYAKICWLQTGVKKEKLVRLSLKEAVKQLPQDRFLQIHRSHLINLERAEGLVREKQKWIVNIDGVELPVSRSRLSAVKNMLSGDT